MMLDKDGKMRDLWIRQGDVLPCCTMDGFLIAALINSGEKPCVRCYDKERCEAKMLRKKIGKNNDEIRK
jgi:hypothetical protein